MSAFESLQLGGNIQINHGVVCVTTMWISMHVFKFKQPHQQTQNPWPLAFLQQCQCGGSLAPALLQLRN